MKTTKTNRGFNLSKFEDVYGNKCSLQKSSLATEDCIWLGVNNPKPQIMASQAKKLGVPTNETTGWIDYPVPEEVFFTTRMHLNQEQVAALLPILQKFVETGEL